MRIQSNSNMLTSNLSQSNNGLNKIYEKLSTGKKINRASDNAAMLSMAKELQKQVRGFQQSDSNIGDALSALKISEGAGSSINDMMQRQRDLALQASNGTLNDDNRAALNTEYQALSEEITRISKSTNYNGQNLTAGGSALSDGTGQVQSGPGANDQTSLNAVDYTSAANTGGIGSLADAQAAIKGLDSEMKNTMQTRVDTGVKMNTMEYSRSAAETSKINQAAALSQAEDLDFAQGIMDKSRAELLSQTSSSALSSFNNMAKGSMQALLGL